KGALESWLATVETQRAAQTSLIAETANAWLTLAADLELLKLAQDTLRTRQESLGLTERSVALGVGSQLTLSQTRTTVETARADVA
ncbi:TolC family protein, partial [Acinetobacter baumannii]